MKVFLSWSKPTSRKVAEALHAWLPNLINALEPWMSSLDIDAGRKWGGEIESQLEVSKVGILCVTPQNLTQPWLMFEAGAISKQVTQVRVIPYLFGITNADLQGPLSQFQAASADRDGTLNLMKSINNAQSTPRTDAQLEKAFNAFWPELQQALVTITEHAATETNSKAPPQRKDRDLLEEMLTILRRLDQPPRLPIDAGSRAHRTDALTQSVRAMVAGMGPEEREAVIGRLAAESGIPTDIFFDMLPGPHEEGLIERLRKKAGTTLK